MDINPLYNPYTKFVDGKQTIEPAAAGAYLDRDALIAQWYPDYKQV